MLFTNVLIDIGLKKNLKTLQITLSCFVSFMKKRKTSLFGGTFDPIHLGHVTVATQAEEHIGASKIILIPAKQSPLKDVRPLANDEHRLKMMSLAIEGRKEFELSDYELKKQSPGFTLETVKHFQSELGSDTSIYWLIGADCVDELPRWYGIDELIDICNVCVMYRAGSARPDFARFKGVLAADRLKKLQKNIIKTSLIDISSTEIRNRLAAGVDVTNMLSPAVADYIKKHHLYLA